MNSKHKGNSFEVFISKRLSKFITAGDRDDVFYRTQNSGGRHTVRERMGLKTHGQAGDITNTHPNGEGFINSICIECKHYKDLKLWSLLTRTNDLILNFWGEAKDNASPENKLPVLILRQNHKPILWVSDERFKESVESRYGIYPLISVFCKSDIILMTL